MFIIGVYMSEVYIYENIKYFYDRCPHVGSV